MAAAWSFFSSAASPASISFATGCRRRSALGSSSSVGVSSSASFSSARWIRSNATTRAPGLFCVFFKNVTSAGTGSFFTFSASSAITPTAARSQFSASGFAPFMPFSTSGKVAASAFTISCHAFAAASFPCPSFCTARSTSMGFDKSSAACKDTAARANKLIRLGFIGQTGKLSQSTPHAKPEFRTLLSRKRQSSANRTVPLATTTTFCLAATALLASSLRQKSIG